MFFDGVPPEGAEAAPKSVAQEGEPRREKRNPAQDRPKPVVFKHDPFKEKACGECHVSKFSQKLTGTMLEVCFKCHDNFLEKAVSKHDPVSEGSCGECHEPHQASLAKLLKKPTPQGCYECHDDYTKLEFKHDPAAEGSCLECHTAHASAHKGLLKTPGNGLCFECHDEADTLGSDAHKDAPETACTSCHDPHGGAREFYLKKPAAGTPPAAEAGP